MAKKKKSSVAWELMRPSNRHTRIRVRVLLCIYDHGTVPGEAVSRTLQSAANVITRIFAQRMEDGSNPL